MHIVLAEKNSGSLVKMASASIHGPRATLAKKARVCPSPRRAPRVHSSALNQIKDEVTKSLAAENEKRRATVPLTTTDAAEGHAYTAIDTSNPSAPRQEGPYRAEDDAAVPAPQAGQPVVLPPPRRAAGTRPADRVGRSDETNILNAAKTDVVFTPSGKTKGGGH